MSFNICLGIALRITLFLGFLQHISKICALSLHLSQNIIGGTVKNTGDHLDLFRCQRIVKRADDGDTAAYTGLKEITAVICRSHLQQLRAVLRHQFLIGRADTFSPLQCHLGELIGYADAAHYLTDYTNLGVIHDQIDIMNNLILKPVTGKLTDIQNILNLHCLAGALCNQLLIVCDHLYHTASDSAVTHNCNLHLIVSLFLCCQCTLSH